MNTDEAIKYLHKHHQATFITKRMLLEEVRRGKITHMRIGGRILFKPIHLDRWIEKKTINA